MRTHLTLAVLFGILSVSLSVGNNLVHRMSSYLGLAELLPQSAAQLAGPPHGSATNHAGDEAHPSEAHPHDGASHASQSHAEETHEGGEHHAPHKVVVTRPVARDVRHTEPYVCQIHSRRHIEVCALEGGYLEAIKINEGQFVKQGETLFHILPTLYSARLDADLAEAQLAQVEYENTKNLVQQSIVSDRELKLSAAKLAKAMAQVKLAQAEMNFADIKAPFDGIVDRLFEQEGSLIEEGSKLTTLSDNSVMWVYFNVPEAKYLKYQARLNSSDSPTALNIELKLANHEIFPQPGQIGAIEADFDNETGNIAFRADFPNPDGLLRHGQTGTILIHEDVQNATVIPQRATFEILAKRYAFVVDEQHVVHQREIQIGMEQDDIYVITDGLTPADNIVLEGILQVRDGEQIDFEFQPPEEVLASLKFHAE